MRIGSKVGVFPRQAVLGKRDSRAVYKLQFILACIQAYNANGGGRRRATKLLDAHTIKKTAAAINVAVVGIGAGAVAVATAGAAADVNADTHVDTYTPGVSQHTDGREHRV